MAVPMALQMILKMKPTTRQDGYETNLREYYNYPWSCYLRHV